LIVTSYFTAVVGIPVYLHYCGGELENVSYLIKKVTCCGEEEEDSEDMGGCCKDENVVLRCAPDFTLKQINTNHFIKAVCELFNVSTPAFNIQIPKIFENILFSDLFPPPKLQNSLVISTSVIRI
jgi:hypothetical protein